MQLKKPPQMSDEEYLLFILSISRNPYIKYKPYFKQSWPIIEANRLTKKYTDDGKLLHNHVLAGAGGFGGKTYLGTMLAAQYLTESNYSCLVTRKNYSELIGIDSIFQNLITWTCNPDLGERACRKVESKVIKIISPSGAEIHFKAFDHESKKQKLKSESYDRIINDEASELDPTILKFQHRSLRQSKDSQIPLSVINLSNPGGPSTNYLIHEYVDEDAKYPYFAIDWRDNPYINREDYEASLDELDIIDLQYQKYGDWHYTPSKGDLISREDIKKALISDPPYKVLYSIMSIDLAGRGMDKTSVCCYELLENSVEYIKDMDQTPSPYPETMIYDFLEKHNPLDREPVTNIILIEQEPGGDSEYSLRYWEKELRAFLEKGISLSLVPVKLSKYQRARPLMRDIKRGQVQINTQTRYLDDFVDEAIRLDPEGNKESPNLVDTLTQAKNFLDKNLKRNKTRFSFKKII